MREFYNQSTKIGKGVGLLLRRRGSSFPQRLRALASDERGQSVAISADEDGVRTPKFME